MKIQAKCKYDQKAVSAMTHLWMFKNANPKKRMRLWTITYSILLLILLLQMWVIGLDTLLVVLTCVLLFVFALECYMYFVMPKRRYKALGKAKDVVNEYTFDDEGFSVATKNDHYRGHDKVTYNQLLRVYETKKYFFIWRDKSRLYMVDKDSVDSAGAEAIRSKLKTYISINYTLCKY